jgi:hypothetical protein
MISTKISLPLTACILALAAAGCATTRTTERQTVPPPARTRDLLGELKAAYATTPMLSINGTLKATGQPITVWLDAIIRRRDSLKILLTGPFGVPIGAMSATPSHFLFFNTQDAEAIEGEPDRETFAKLLMVNLNYDEMISLLRGEIPHVPEEGSYTVEESEGLWTYRIGGIGTREEFTIDPEDLSVRSYNRWTMQGDSALPEIAITYSDFVTLGRRRFPRQALVDILGGEQRIRVAIEKLADAVAADRTFAIDVPAGVPRRKI